MRGDAGRGLLVVGWDGEFGFGGFAEGTAIGVAVAGGVGVGREELGGEG